jgi:hypothetical protein
MIGPKSSARFAPKASSIFIYFFSIGLTLFELPLSWAIPSALQTKPRLPVNVIKPQIKLQTKPQVRPTQTSNHKPYTNKTLQDSRFRSTFPSKKEVNDAYKKHTATGYEGLDLKDRKKLLEENTKKFEAQNKLDNDKRVEEIRRERAEKKAEEARYRH